MSLHQRSSRGLVFIPGVPSVTRPSFVMQATFGVFRLACILTRCVKQSVNRRDLNGDLFVG